MLEEPLWQVKASKPALKKVGLEGKVETITVCPVVTVEIHVVGSDRGRVGAVKVAVSISAVGSSGFSLLAPLTLASFLEQVGVREQGVQAVAQLWRCHGHGACADKTEV